MSELDQNVATAELMLAEAYKAHIASLGGATKAIAAANELLKDEIRGRAQMNKLVSTSTVQAMAEAKAAQDKTTAYRALANNMLALGVPLADVNKIVKEGGISLSITKKDFADAFSALSKGRLTFGEFSKSVGGFKGMLSTLTPALTGATIGIAAFKVAMDAYDAYAKVRVARYSLTGTAGSTNYGDFTTGVDKEIIKSVISGKVGGMESKDVLENLGRLATSGFITGKDLNEKGNLTDTAARKLGAVTQAQTGAKVLYNIDFSESEQMFKTLMFSFHKPADQLSDVFTNMARTVSKSDVNINEFVKYFNVLSPGLAKYGGNLNQVSEITVEFGKLLREKKIDIADFTNAFSARTGASTGSQLAFYQLAKAKGIALPGLGVTAGMSGMAISGSMRAWSGTNKTDALRASILTAEAYTPSSEKTPQGRLERARNFGALPDAQAIFNAATPETYEALLTWAKKSGPENALINILNAQSTPSGTMSSDVTGRHIKDSSFLGLPFAIGDVMAQTYSKGGNPLAGTEGMPGVQTAIVVMSSLIDSLNVLTKATTEGNNREVVLRVVGANKIVDFVVEEVKKLGLTR